MWVDAGKKTIWLICPLVHLETGGAALRVGEMDNHSMMKPGQMLTNNYIKLTLVSLVGHRVAWQI